MTAALSTTSTLPILQAVSTLLETALRDPTYTFPTVAHGTESSNSLQHSQSTSHGLANAAGSSSHNHTRSYSASISSMPSIGMAGRDQVLDDLGMRGLGELSFSQMKGERLAVGAKLVAALIDSFTV